MGRTLTLPQDSALPALGRLLAVGLAAVLPALGIDNDGSRSLNPEERRYELRLRAHKPGRHATLEARTADRHLAVLVYAKRPELEVELYPALAAEGLTSGSGARVPGLLTWDPELRLLALEWLEGPTVSDLLKRGEGERAGALAAAWIERAASIFIPLGKRYDAGRLLEHADKWTSALAEAGPDLGAAAAQLTDRLRRTAPRGGTCRLVHGAFHDRNIVDLGDGPGVIDWHQFGQGPAEIEGGMFLASLSRAAMKKGRAAEAERAEAVFLERTGPLLDRRALAWHRAAALLSRTRRMLTHRRGDWDDRARALLEKADAIAGGAA